MAIEPNIWPAKRLLRHAPRHMLCLLFHSASILFSILLRCYADEIMANANVPPCTSVAWLSVH